MRKAYKAFNKDLTCTMGRGTFQYEPGVWYEEAEANCVKNGFHCAENPLDCMNYYGCWENSQYWEVEIDGDIDEDGTDTKISATKIRVVRRLRLGEFVTAAVEYILDHPDLAMNARVATENRPLRREEPFLIVRNKAPAAAAVKKGQIIALLQESADSNEIEAAAAWLIDGAQYRTGVFYDVQGRAVVPC